MITRKRHRHRPAWTGAFLATGLLACGGVDGATTAGDDAAADAAPQVLATIGGEPVTMEDVRARIGDELDRMDAEYGRARYRALETSLQEILGERVLQAELHDRGRTLDELVEAEAGGSLEPTPAEVAAWYAENGARLRGRSLEQARSQITNYLVAQRRQEVAQQLEARLMDEAGVRVTLEPYRARLDNTGAPAKGPADAPVTLVEFSDFQCPYCVRFSQMLDQLTAEFGDELRVVYRHFPLTNIHANAERAAEASFCAGEQGRFWEMHDLMFQEQDRLGAGDLKEKASRLALDRAAFDACLESGRAVERIRADQSEGRRVGVGGTPALFINGIAVEGGAVPYAVIEAAIRAEQQRLSR